jgi:hypothetical protein
VADARVVMLRRWRPGGQLRLLEGLEQAFGVGVSLLPHARPTDHGQPQHHREEVHCRRGTDELRVASDEGGGEPVAHVGRKGVRGPGTSSSGRRLER